MMRAFVVERNSRRLCLAGVGTNGVLTAIVSHVVGPARRSELKLDIGGLFSETNEHVRWLHVDLKVGDRLALTVIETESVDKPKEKYPHNAKADCENRKAYVRAMAKQL